MFFEFISELILINTSFDDRLNEETQYLFDSLVEISYLKYSN